MTDGSPVAPTGRSRFARGAGSFLREIVIVVSGVLIALVLQEVVSDWRDQRRVRAIQETMREDISDAAEVFAFRLRTRACLTAKLDAVEAILRQRGATGPWRVVGRPSYFFSSQGAWDGANTDLLSSQMPAARFQSYGMTYEGISQYHARAQLEQDHWTVLQSLERQDAPLEGERRWRLFEALAAARNDATILNAIAEQTATRIRGMGISPTGQLASVRVETLPVCQPLDRVGLQ